MKNIWIFTDSGIFNEREGVDAILDFNKTLQFNFFVEKPYQTHIIIQSRTFHILYILKHVWGSSMKVA